MRILALCSLLAVLAAAVLAWDQEDYEIFDLVSDVEASEGKGTTFYSWLDVPLTASTAEIARAYRKLSMQLHPDKNPGDKKIGERFARLGVVSAILRNSESRARYDFFYKNGVPKWRGTGYYYSRFRPGLGTVIVFLIALTSGLQYLIQRINYKRDLDRVTEIIGGARLAAWGPKLTPIEGKRKVKVNLAGPNRYDEDGDPLPGRWLDMVVDSQNVYILESSGELTLLDTSAAIPASISRTWFISLMRSLYQKLANRGSTKGPVDSHQRQEMDEDGDDSSSTSEAPSRPGSGTTTPREDGLTSRGPAVKSGGKRRKQTKRPR